MGSRELLVVRHSTHEHTDGDNRRQCDVARGGRAEQRDMGKLSGDVNQASEGHPKTGKGNMRFHENRHKGVLGRR